MTLEILLFPSLSSAEMYCILTEKEKRVVQRLSLRAYRSIITRKKMRGSRQAMYIEMKKRRWW